MTNTRPQLLAVFLIASCAPSPAARSPSDDAEVSANAAAAPPPTADPSSPTAQVSESTPSAVGTASIEAQSESTDPASTSASESTLPPVGTYGSGPNPEQATTPVVGPSGPAIGGPRSNRPCEFHESVDSYQRLCTTRKNADGSLHIEAKGTRLNPSNGFEFTLHGGPYNFFAHGTLNAFGICDGPFTSQVNTVIENGVTTYELRFKEHCKIVVR